MLSIQPRLRVKKVRTADLVPYAGNAKEHPEKQIAEICESIEQFGFCDPVGTWKDPETGELTIVEGHGRVLAAQRLGMDELPTISLDHLDDEARRAYILAHNQTTMSSGFNLEMLQRELDRITGLDMSRFGFEPARVLEELPDADDLPTPAETEQRTEGGQVWLMGEHRLVCGDSCDPETLARLMGDERADLLLTDPPYGVGYVGGTDDALTIENDEWDSDAELENFLADALSCAAACLKPGGAFYVWFATRKAMAAYGACARARLDIKQELYWVKSQFTLGRQDYQWQTEPTLYGWKDGAPHYFAPTRTERNVLDDLSKVDGMTKAELRELVTSIVAGEVVETDALRHEKPSASRLHPTMKPVALFARLVRNSSRPGEVVLDPFGGSGTTLIACEQLGRKARLVELDPHYCDVIVTRWEQATGRKAERG